MQAFSVCNEERQVASRGACSCIFIQPSISGEKIRSSTPAWDTAIKGNLHSLWAAGREILPASDFLQLFLIQSNPHGTVVDLGVAYTDPVHLLPFSSIL